MPEFVHPFSGMTPGRKITDRELVRAVRLSLSAEEEAVHLYEAIADATDNELAHAVLQDIANEERVHKGEFQRLLTILAPDESEFMSRGATEVDELRDNISGILPSRAPEQPMATVGDLKDGM